MNRMKFVVAFLVCAPMSFLAIAEDIVGDSDAIPSPEVQCVNSDSYEDVSGYWHDCPGIEAQAEEAEDDQEWPVDQEWPEDEQLNEYEEAESYQQVNEE